MKVIADLNMCQGHGLCSMAAPDVYDHDEDGLVVVKLDAIPPELADAAADGVEGCPEMALSIVEE